jgi:hypothetical protein
MLLARYALGEHSFASKENSNETDCFCIGGRSIRFGGRIIGFTSGANCTAGVRHHRHERQPDPSAVLALAPPALASPPLLARPLGPPALPVLVSFPRICFPARISRST